MSKSYADITPANSYEELLTQFLGLKRLTVHLENTNKKLIENNRLLKEKIKLLDTSELVEKLELIQKLTNELENYEKT